MKFPSKWVISGGIATIIHPVVKFCATATKASVEESIEPIELTIVLVLPTVRKKKKFQHQSWLSTGKSPEDNSLSGRTR